METHYLSGVILGVVSGALVQTGQLLEKNAVNSLPPQVREQSLMRALLTSPMWLTGLFMAIGFGSAGLMVSMHLIGPALVPGLMASGLIVLAIGSVTMNKESLGRDEALGIVLMVIGITLLGLSRLGINADYVRTALADRLTLVRIAVFSLCLIALWGGLALLGTKSTRRKGILLAFSNGFPFSLSNFWLSPLVALLPIVLRGRGTFEQIAIFILACVILVGVNLLGIWQTQVAFRYAQASNVVPVQQMTVQIVPVIIYFGVFALKAPSINALVCILAGVALIILSGFLLGKRTAPEAGAVSTAMGQPT